MSPGPLLARVETAWAFCTLLAGATYGASRRVGEQHPPFPVYVLELCRQCLSVFGVPTHVSFWPGRRTGT